MEAVIADNNLQKKVRFVETDNASNMVKAMSVLFDAGDASCMDPNADRSLWEDMMLTSTNQSLPVCQLVCQW